VRTGVQETFCLIGTAIKDWSKQFVKVGADGTRGRAMQSLQNE
jgi:hypothetical protein